MTIEKAASVRQGSKAMESCHVKVLTHQGELLLRSSDQILAVVLNMLPSIPEVYCR